MTTHSAGWNFDNSYARLPDLFFVKQGPTPVRDPRIVVFNSALADSLGLKPSALDNRDGAAVFAGNTIPSGSEPITQAYAGHQFGHFTMLGDGRAVLLGEQVTPAGQRFDIQLKGAGPTDFSRRGDGRATLGAMLREYIISEAMHALKIPTTRSLAVVTTGEPVYRETMLPGAILTRVAASHIRVGTFEYAARRGGAEAIKALADYTLQRHYPELIDADKPYEALLHAVMGRQAVLIAKWMQVGFIHGVMNTDNMTLSGETIDYGPCAFMDVYDPVTVFSSIDHQGRYAYSNQPPIAQWNLARLAETFLPLLDSDEKKAIELAAGAIASFPVVYEQHFLNGMRAKLGLFTQELDDTALINSFLSYLHSHKKDFTHTFRQLSSESLQNDSLMQETAFIEWYAQWQSRLARQSESLDQVRDLMNENNPLVIPRNHRVEEALKAAVEHHDFSVMTNLLSALEKPFTDVSQHVDYHIPPEFISMNYQTFCGT